MADKIGSIDNNRSAPVGGGRAVQRSKDAATGEPKQHDASLKDVNITDTATRLASLEQSLKDLPAVDEAKVAGVRQALEERRYAVEPGKIADSLLHLEQMLGRLPADRE